MQTPIDAQTRAHFLTLKPLAFLQKWLQDLIEQEKHHQKLFATKGQAFEVLFDDQNPVIIPILFAPKTIAMLHLKLTRIQRALRQEKITPLAILQQVAPALGNFYAQAFTEKVTPFERFDVLLGSLFGRDKKGYHTTKTSSDIYKTRGIELSQAKNPKPEYTPQGALTELQTLEKQLTPSHLQTVRQAIEKGDLKPYLQLLHQDLRRQALGSYQKLSRQTVLQAMSHAAFQTLSLKGLDPTDEDLRAILARSAAGLKHLDLSGCTRLSPKVLLWIQDSCLQLESLILRGWTQLKQVDAANLAPKRLFNFGQTEPVLLKFPKLHTLILDKSSLTTLYIQAPLEKLSLKQAKQLTTISLSAFQLKQLLLDECEMHKTKVQSLIRNQNQLEKLSLKACPKIAAKFQKCGILLRFSSDHKIHTFTDELLETEEVNLSNRRIDDELARAIARVLPSTKIHTLKLSSNQIGEKGAESLARVLPSTKIHTLYLYSNKIGEKGAESLACVLPSTKIHTLSLWNNEIGEKGAESLACVLPSTKIHTLSLWNNEIGDLGAESLARMLPSTKIHTIDVSSNKIGEKGAESLTRVLPSTKIHNLYLYSNKIGEKGAESLACVLPSTKIHTLDLYSNQIGEKGAESLARVLPSTKIHTLKLSSNKIGEKGAESLARVLPSTKIHTIDVSHNQIGEKGAESLTRVLPSTKIHNLDVSSNKIGDLGAESLARVLPSTKIHTLDLYSNKIGEKGAESLARVLPSTKIHTIDVSHNQIGDLGAESLARVLPSTKIHTLNLRDNKIGDLGAESLARVLPSTKIHTLKLSYNQIGDLGAESLARVLPSTKIHNLKLSSNKIGEKGAESLARVLPSTKIHTLWLSYNQIGDLGAESLARVLPSTKIHTLKLSSNKIGDALLKKIESLCKPRPVRSNSSPKPEAEREASPSSNSVKQTPIKPPTNSITTVKSNPKLGYLLETMHFLLQKHFPMEKLYVCDATTQREVAHIQAQLIEYETTPPKTSDEIQQAIKYLQAMLDYVIDQGALKTRRDTSWAMLNLRLRPPNGATVDDQLVSYVNAWAFARQRAGYGFDPLAVREIQRRHKWSIPIRTIPDTRTYGEQTSSASHSPTIYNSNRDMYIGNKINVYHDKRVVIYKS